MKTPLKQISLASLLYLAGLSTSQGAILAYEGFASDAAGSGQNYEQDVVLQGVDKTRTGFTGAWFEASGTLSADFNVESVSGNLTYSNYIVGTEGRTSAFNGSSPVSSNSGLGRSFGVDDGDVSNGYYLAMLIDFNNSEGGFSLQSGQGSVNSLTLNNSTLSFAPGGGSASGGFGEDISTLGVSASGSNLFVLHYTDDTTDSPNGIFYTRWNLYINPDLSGGTLNIADIDATGFGIGLLNGGSAVAPNYVSINNSRINAGANMFADEIYLTNDPADFVIPEPSTVALFAGLAAFGFCYWRRRR